MKTTTTTNTASALKVSREFFDKAIDRLDLKSVDRYRLYGPDGDPTPVHGLCTSDGEWLNNGVTDRYTPHTPDDVRALARAAGAAFEHEGVNTLQITSHWRNGHYVTVAPAKEDLVAAFDAKHPGTGLHHVDRNSDVLVPGLMVQAGYDGKAFRFSSYLRRLACRNMLMFDIAEFSTSVSVRHTTGLTDRIPELVDQARRAMLGLNKVKEAIVKANETEVKVAEFIRTLYPEPKEDATARVRNAHVKRIESIISRMARERETLQGRTGDLSRATAWEIFNAVQGYTQHDKNRKGSPSPMDRAILANEDTTVRKAAELAFNPTEDMLVLA